MLVEISDPVDDTRASADYRRGVLPRLLANNFASVKEQIWRYDGSSRSGAQGQWRERICSRVGRIKALKILRDGLRITGPKRGCNQGVCGACNILCLWINDRSALVCRLPAFSKVEKLRRSKGCS